jgi:hypothetical protein
MNFAFLDPAPDACAAALGEHLRADYGDQDHLRQLADEVDLVTFEFESVPAETVAFLAVRAGLPERRSPAHRPRPLVREEHVQGPGDSDPGLRRHSRKPTSTPPWPASACRPC